MPRDEDALKEYCAHLQVGAAWTAAGAEAEGYRVQISPPAGNFLVERGAAFNRYVVKFDAGSRIESFQYFPD